MDMRTPLSRVKGLGSAKEGTHHFWHQRLSAVALVPLSLWFMYSMVNLGGAEHAAVVSWMGQTHVAVLLISFVLSLFYHAQLGMQVVVEDYMHVEWQKVTGLIVVKFIAVIAGLTSILSILNIYLGLNLS